MFSKLFKQWPASKKTDPIGEINQRLENNPRDVLTLMERAEAFLTRYDAEAALSDLERALQIALLESRLQGEARSALLARLYSMQSQALSGQGHSAEALAAAEKAVAEKSDSLEALTQRGRLYREAGDFANALSDFDRVLAVDKTYSNAYLARGITHQRMGYAERALADFDQVIRLDEANGLAWGKRAHIHLERNNLQQAIRDIETAIQLDTHLLEPYADLAIIARHPKHRKKALRIIQQGLKHHQEKIRLGIETARSLIDYQLLPEALSLLNDVLADSPDHAEALAVRGQIYGRTENLPLALADLGRSVELDPSNAENYFNYALAHMHTKHWMEALAALSRVLQLTPQDEEARVWRLRLAQQLGIETLDQAARTLEDFVYSQCGPGVGWKVEPRQMHTFKPDGSVETYNAAVLDLLQTPQTLLVVRVTDTEYRLQALVEKPIPGAPRTPLGESLTRTIPARSESLLELLHHLVTEGWLVKVGNQLRWVDKEQQKG